MCQVNKPWLLIEDSTIYLEEFEDGAIFYHLHEHQSFPERFFCEIGSVDSAEIAEDEIEGESDKDLEGMKQYQALEPLTELHG